MLDVGAGPGTASWAAAEAFPSLQRFALLDANSTLAAAPRRLISPPAARGLAGIDYRHGEARALLAEAAPADLAVASYMIGEIVPTERRTLRRSHVGENP